MGKISNSDTQLDNMKRGLFLNYNTNLSAVPYNQDTANSKEEQNLLMFCLKSNPKMIHDD